MVCVLRAASLVALVLIGAGCGSDSASPAAGGSDPDVDASVDAASPADPPDQPGGFEVGHQSITAVDPDRGGRTIPVEVWYPIDPGTAGDAPVTNLPLAAGIGLESEVAVDGAPVSARDDQSLVVFSHGYGGINTQSVDLMEALASHGFVVASPEHVGNSQSSPGDTFDDAAAQRVPDVSLVIDTMIERNRDPEDPFFERLDEENVGVVGHSFGAMTALGTAAGWAGADPDERVAAIVPISGVVDAELQEDVRTGPNAGFDADQLGSVDVPVMLIGGTEDQDVSVENNGIAFEQLTDSPAVYRVDVIGATHTHFANVCTFGSLLLDLGIAPAQWPDVGAADLIDPFELTCGPDSFPIEEAVRLQNLYVVSFLRRHLLGDEGYAVHLSDDDAATEPAVDFATR